MADDAADGAWSWDLRTDNLTWSDELYRIFGLARDAGPPTVEGWLGRAHPEDLQQLADGLKRARSGTVPFDLTHRVVRAGQDARVVRVRGWGITDQGRTPRWITGTIEDITGDRLAGQSVGRGSAGRRGRVLIVDHEVLLTNALRRLLSRDHEVTVFNDPAAALEQLRGGARFDAILCDLVMPGIGGVELYERVTAISMDQAHRIIFMTGESAAQAAKEFFDRVTNPRFEKGCNLGPLHSAVRRLVD